MFSHGCRIWKEAQRKQLCLIYSKSSNRKLRKCRGLIPAVSSSLSAIVREKKRNSLFRWTHRMLVRIGWSVRLFRTKSGITCNCFTHFWNNRLVFIFFLLELRLAQLALDPKNSPSWDVPVQEKRPSTKIPLFVKSLPVYKSKHPTEVTLSFQLMANQYRRIVINLWIDWIDRCGVAVFIRLKFRKQVHLCAIWVPAFRISFGSSQPTG